MGANQQTAVFPFELLEAPVNQYLPPSMHHRDILLVRQQAANIGQRHQLDTALGAGTQIRFWRGPNQMIQHPQLRLGQA